MWTWLRELWLDKSAFNIFLRGVAVGAGVYLSTPTGRSEWERLMPAIIAAIGSAIPSSRSAGS